MTDCSFLSGLTTLQRLELADNFLTECHCVSGLINLEALHLNNNDLPDCNDHLTLLLPEFETWNNRCHYTTNTDHRIPMLLCIIRAHGERVTPTTTGPDVGLFSSTLLAPRSCSCFINREPSLGSIQYTVKGPVVVFRSNAMGSEERL